MSYLSIPCMMLQKSEKTETFPKGIHLLDGIGLRVFVRVSIEE